MKTKITSRKLVRALYLEAEEHKMSPAKRLDYFLYGYIEVMKSGLDELEYWRCVLIAYPDLAGKAYETLTTYETLVNGVGVNHAVKDFLKKMALLA